jgi:hypothetical protein
MNQFLPAPEYPIRTVFEIRGDIRENECLSAVSKTPAINCSPVSTTPANNPCHGFSRKSRDRLPLTLSLSELIPVFSPVPATCVPHHSTLVSDPVPLLSLSLVPFHLLSVWQKSEFQGWNPTPSRGGGGGGGSWWAIRLSQVISHHQAGQFQTYFPVLLTTVVLFRWMQYCIHFLGILCL